MLSTCRSRGVSTHPSTLPRSQDMSLAEAHCFFHLTEKEARIAKEKELGIYKEHKVGTS